jgi:hypothetical protein
MTINDDDDDDEVKHCPLYSGKYGSYNCIEGIRWKKFWVVGHEDWMSDTKKRVLNLMQKAV